MILDILFTLFLVLLNGFFVAAEFSIVKVRMSQLDIKIKGGSNRAKVTKGIVERLDSYISATQLGITIASLGLGWIGEKIVSRIVLALMHFLGADISTEMIHTIAFPITFAFITFTHIVFGELIPKALAIKYPLQVSMNTSFPLKVFRTALIPAIWVLQKFATFLLSIAGMKMELGHEIHTEEELKLLLTESEEGGAIKASEHDLIQNVFDFDDRIVKQILVPENKIFALDIKLSDEEITEKILTEGYSRVPVYKDSLDNIMGVVFAKDLLKVIRKEEVKIKDIIRPAYFIPGTKKINELLREFQSQHIQMAIVTNESGGTIGLVTMEDIIEELVGEIHDENDEEKPLVDKKSETEFIITASAKITDVNDLLPIALPENPHYDSISGFVNFIFDRIPALNEKKNFGGYEISILKRFKHSVEFVRFKVIEGGEVLSIKR